jgi:hypothetical protein
MWHWHGRAPGHTDSSSQPDPQDLLDSYVDRQAPATMAGMRRDLALRIKAKGMRRAGGAGRRGSWRAPC